MEKIIASLDRVGMKGRFRAREWAAGTGPKTLAEARAREALWESPWSENLVVSSAGHGRNIVLRQLMGDTTYPMEIDSADIGTGTNAPADSDTALQTPAVTGLLITDAEISGDQLTLNIFASDDTLPEATYTEFGLLCGARRFSRALISPSYTKNPSRDTTFEYVITLAAA